jgi:transposase InsO family protein
MQKEGLRTVHALRFFQRTTDGKHGKRVGANLLLEQPKPDRPHAACTSDITYLPLKSGKRAYLCARIDLYSRQIVGWQLGDNMQESLVREALVREL